MTVESSDPLKCHTDLFCSSVASEVATKLFQVPPELPGARGWEVQERLGLSNFLPLKKGCQIPGALQVLA